MPASTILLLESDAAASRDRSAAILTGAGYTVTRTADPDEAFGKAAEHQLVDHRRRHAARRPRSTSAARSGPRRRSPPCRSCASAPATTSRSGSGSSRPAPTTSWREPFDARELEARVEALLLRFQRSKDLTPIVSPDGLTMHRAAPDGRRLQPARAASGRRRSRRTSRSRRPRGGRTASSSSTSHLQFGEVATHLNLDPKQTLADVVRDEAAMREPELLRTYATRHDSGLHVLAAPTAPGARRARHGGARRRRS